MGQYQYINRSSCWFMAELEFKFTSVWVELQQISKLPKIFSNHFSAGKTAVKSLIPVQRLQPWEDEDNSDVMSKWGDHSEVMRTCGDSGEVMRTCGDEWVWRGKWVAPFWRVAELEDAKKKIWDTRGWVEKSEAKFQTQWGLKSWEAPDSPCWKLMLVDKQEPKER